MTELIAQKTTNTDVTIFSAEAKFIYICGNIIQEGTCIIL